MEIVLTGSSGKVFRLDIRTDKGAYTGQLAPESWDLLSPFPMNTADFENLRKRFGGLGEASKTVLLASLGMSATADSSAIEQELMLRIRRLFNVYTVQGVGCGEMLFSGSKKEIIKEDKVLLAIISGRYVRLPVSSNVSILGTPFSEVLTSLSLSLSSWTFTTRIQW